MSTPIPKATEAKQRFHGEGRLSETKPQKLPSAETELKMLKKEHNGNKNGYPTITHKNTIN